MSRKTTFDCAECGMLQEGPMFHPYWHCVLFKAGIDPRHLEAETVALDVERLARALSADGKHDPEMWALLGPPSREYFTNKARNLIAEYARLAAQEEGFWETLWKCVVYCRWGLYT